MRRCLPIMWLVLHRRRHFVVALVLAMALFETLIIVIAHATPPIRLLGGEVRALPGLFRAVSGSGGVPVTTYPGLLGLGLVHPFWVAMQLTAVGSLAAAVLASDIESGTVELVLVRPVSRMRVLAERVGAMLIVLVLLNAAAAAAVATGIALSPPLRSAIPIGRVVLAGAAGLCLALSIAGPAVAVSTMGRRRAQVIGATVVMGAGGYTLNFIAIAWAKVSVLRYASPFHYYVPADILAFGRVPWSSIGVLLGVAVAGIAVSAASFTRRDLVA